MFRWMAPGRGRLTSGRPLRPGRVLTEPPRPFPWLVLLAALLLLGTAGVVGFDQLQQHRAEQVPPSPPSPTTGPIEKFHLEGPRGPACLRLVIGVDDSSSMSEFAAARDAALTELVRWVPSQLRDTDEMAVVDFAMNAAVRMPATPLPALGSVPHAPAVLDGTATLLGPVAAAVAAMPPTECDVALVLLSDAQLGDLPPGHNAGLRFQSDHGLHDVDLLVPGERVQVPPEWSRAFPEAPPRRFEGLDTDATALAVARTIAELTGQQLAS